MDGVRAIAVGDTQGVFGRLRAATAQLRGDAQHALREEAILRARTDEALHLAREQLSAGLGRAPFALAAVDRDGLFSLAVGGALEAAGLAPAHLLGRSVFEAFADQPRFLASVVGALAGEETTAQLVLAERVLETRSGPRRDRAGALNGAVITWVDATERLRAEDERARAEDELRLANERLESLRARALADAHSHGGTRGGSCLFEAALSQAGAKAIASAEFGVDGPTIIIANEGFQRLTGYTADEIVGKPLAILGGPRMDGMLRRARELLGSGEAFCEEVLLHRKDGSSLETEWEMAAIRDERGGVTNYLLVQHDISERKRAQKAVEYQALHDALTELPNRSLLQDRLEQAIHVARREGTPLCLLLMDLDNFKDVNDTFGHQTGDVLLRLVAARLIEGLRDTDTVARLGGDEFAMVLPGTDLEGTIGVARKLLAALDRPFSVLGQDLDVQASVGVAAYPAEGAHRDELLRRADVAMYVAKRSHAGVAVYKPEDDEHSPDRLLLISELRHAIDRGELVVHYQPQVSFATGRVIAMEALVRWQHPRRGLVPPMVFVPLAERTGLIKPLFEYVLGAALEQCAEWSRVWDHPVVAVNVAMPNIMDPRFAHIVDAALRRHDVTPDRLVLEITESVIMADAERACAIVAELRATGVQVSIDDFGTGYSSMGYLQRLSVNEIKIDKSFVIGVAEDRNRAAIVRATIDLGHQFGLHVVAEGVEDQRSWDILYTSGCDTAQGYYISPPLPAAEALSSLVDRGWMPRAAQPVLFDGIVNGTPALLHFAGAARDVG